MILKPEISLTPEDTEEIKPGLYCEWFFNKRIIAYRLTIVTQGLLETWSNYVIDTLKRWPADRPYLAMHNLSQPGISLQYASLVNFDTANIGILPDYREQAETLLAEREQVGSRVAITFSLSLSGKVNKTLADRHKSRSLIDYRTFYNRARSLAWLALNINDTTHSQEAIRLGQ